MVEMDKWAKVSKHDDDKLAKVTMKHSNYNHPVYVYERKAKWGPEPSALDPSPFRAATRRFGSTPRQLSFLRSLNSILFLLIPFASALAYSNLYSFCISH